MAEPVSLEDLLGACAQGDRRALRQIYELTAAQLLGVALWIVGDRRLAEDALHEAFLRIWREAGGFTASRGSAQAWIVSIVRYRAIETLRRRRHEIVDPEGTKPPLADPSPAVLHILASNQERARLRACLERLAASQREATLLAFLTGSTHEEMAERLRAPLGTTRSWIRRGLIALRQCMER